MTTASSLTMLTSGVSQYLHPDYLQPLPTTLDAKKSPLALLAQTCSAIGKDSSHCKSIIPPLDKKDCDKFDRCLDSETSSKRPNSHGSKDSGKESKPGFRTFPPKDIPALVPISSVNSDKSLRTPSVEPRPSASPGSLPSASSHSFLMSSRPVSAGSHTPGQRSSSRSSNGRSEGNGSDYQHSSRHHQSPHLHQCDSPGSTGSSSYPSTACTSYCKSTSSPPTGSSSYPSTPCTSYCKSTSSHSTSAMQSTAAKSSVTHPSMLGGIPVTSHLSGYPSHLGLMGHVLDPSSSSYHAALAAHSGISSFAAAVAQSSALKAAAAAGATTALSPFVTYARVRTPSGATTLVPVCRDPFCTNCQLTVQNSHLSSTCNSPGCSQCAHEKSLTNLSAVGFPAASAMFLPSFTTASSLSSSASALSSLHSLYPHTVLTAAHQGLPYICSWVSGSDFCGKRFSSSEDLLQHLRTHTSTMDMSSLAASYAGLGLPAGLAAYPHLSAPLSPNTLRRTYPTSISPVSSLLGANRYHPYKSPLSGIGATQPTPQSFTPVGPYYSPYTLYGQRLGAAVVP